MLDDGDTVLNLVGVALVVAVLVGVGVVAIGFSTGPSESDAPAANWSVDRVNDSFVAITHAGGEPVEPEKLVVTVDSLERAADWPRLVTEGDTAVVRASEGALVRIIWDAGRGETQALARWRV